MIRLSGLCYAVRRGKQRVPVFDRLELELPAGRCIGVIGNRGSGKSSLLHLLCGQIIPDSGTIEIDGRVALPLGKAPWLSAKLNGRENTLFIARLLGLPATSMTAKVEQYAHLGRHFAAPVATYSPQQKQQLAFAIELAADYQWHLVDGSIEIGTPLFQRRHFPDYFAQLKRTGSLLIAAPKPGLIKQHCDSLVVVNQGKAVYYDELNQGIKAYQSISHTPNSPARKRSNQHHTSVIAPKALDNE